MQSTRWDELYHLRERAIRRVSTDADLDGVLLFTIQFKDGVLDWSVEHEPAEASG